MTRHPLFDSDDLTEDLAGRSVRGGAFVLGSQGTLLALNLLSTVALARLLTPAEFGLVAMVMAVTTFAQCFQELGLGVSTVQRAAITPEHVSTLFWINAAAAIAVAAATAALGPAVAWFFGEPRLAWITAAMATTLLFHGLSAQHRALLERRMRFRALAVIRVGGGLAGVTAAIVAATLGAGIWSLVALYTVPPAVLMVASWAVCRWRPSWPSRGTGAWSAVRFGGYLTANNALQSIVRNIDNLLIGRVFGPGPLGYYSNAYKLLMLPITQLSRPAGGVLIPALSRLQDQPERYRAFYRRCVEVLAAVSIPLVLGCLAAAENLVLTLLGDQWLASVPLFRALAPAALLEAMYAVTLWVYVSLGRADRMFRWRMLSAAVTTAAIVIGLAWGPLGVAIGFSAAVCLLRGPEVIYSMHGTPLVPRDLLAGVWRPLVAAAIAAAAVVAVDLTLLAETAPVAGLALEGLLFAVVYLLGWLPFPGGGRKLAGLMGMARHLGAAGG